MNVPNPDTTELAHVMFGWIIYYLENGNTPTTGIDPQLSELNRQYPMLIPEYCIRKLIEIQKIMDVIKYLQAHINE